MQNTFRNAVLVIILLGLCLLAIFPVESSLKLGKDLAGGVSLVYTVELDEEDGPEVVDRTIEVLKDRVNPQGLYEISMIRQGRNRIEVTMPLPNEEVQNLRDAYEVSLDGFAAYEIDIDEFESAMRLEPRERLTALQEMANRSEAKAAILSEVIAAAQTALISRRAYEAAQNRAQDEDSLDDLLPSDCETSTG